MRTIHLFGLVSLLLMMSIIKLQGQEYHFYQSKSIGSQGMVYFKIMNIPDSEEQERVLSALLFDENISDGDIYYDVNTNETT